MTNPLSLHHVTAMELRPPELISVAADLGLHHVCLFTCIAPEAASLFPCSWNTAVRRETASRCSDLGVIVHNIEWFDLTADSDLDFQREGLELGAELGARTATTHVVDSDSSRAAENFSRFCALADEYGIVPCIEFTALIGTPTLAAAVDLIDRAGHPNAGIALDTLHLFRSGGSVEDVRALDPRYIRSVQISDGPAQRGADEYFEEAVYERQIPGEGEFPLTSFLPIIPADMILDVEVPLRSYQKQGLEGRERARLAVAGLRRLLTEGLSR